MKKIIVFIAFLSAVSGFSQNMKISGTIIDTNLFQPVYYAKTHLIRVSDSVIYHYKNTDENGTFEYIVPVDTYRLFLSHPNFNDKEFIFVGTAENNDFELGELSLAEKGSMIEGLTIYAYKDPIYYKGDTLIYVADSFATKDNAMVEDLLKRLPGITVEDDGSIKSQGKEISKVLVDGDEFFGSDPTIATKNLAAKSIDKVQIYETNPENGSATDDKIQVLDLKLKAEAKKGWFAKASAATDFRQFYEGQLLYNRFQNKQKIFAFGLGSNTLNSAVSKSDASAAGVSSQFLGGGGSVSGYPQTFRLGGLFNDQITEKFKLGVDYIFSDSRVKKETEKNTEYLLPDTTYYSQYREEQYSKNQTHNLGININLNPDSSQTLMIQPRFSLSTAENNSLSVNNFLDANQNAVRRADNSTSSTTNSFSTNTRLHYRKRFAKERRTLELTDYIVYNQSKNKNSLLYSDYFYLLGYTDNEIRQMKNNDNNNFGNTLNAAYTEPLSDKWKMTFNYELYNNVNSKELLSYNYDGTAYTDLDSATSNRFKTNKIQNKAGIGINYDNKTHSIAIGMNVRNVLVNNENFFTLKSINQNVTNALPSFTYRYKISQNSRLNTRISTNSSLPNVDYLSPARDNTNPNAVLMGNENLKPDYNISANADYSIFKPISGINFNIGASAKYTFNDFARSVTYDSLGRSVSMYQNINTFNALSGNLYFSVPLFKKVIRLSPRFDYTNSNQNSFVDGVNNLANVHNFIPELNISALTDFMEISTGLRLTEQIGKNSINTNLNIRNTVWRYNFDMKFFLPWKIDVSTNANYNNYSNMSQGYNINYFIWNAAIEKRIGKYDQWKLGIEGYDLMNQNTQVSRTISINTIVDSRINIITRYFLFRITYSFNSTLRVNTSKNEAK